MLVLRNLSLVVYSVMVFHVGLFVFAFFSKSRFRLKCSKVTETRTQTCLLVSYIIVNLKVEVVVEFEAIEQAQQ